MGEEQAMDPLAGSRFGPHRLLNKIGEGGMGVVYKGYQESLGRYVAVKVLRSELASDRQFITRFRQEARAVARLNHANLLHVYDAGIVNGIYYIAMDYVEGGSLRDLLRRGPLPIDQAVSIAAQVADALAYAHQQGLVHRDVKPANILLAEDQRPLLTDFGIARAVDASMRLTQTGSHMGTPEYMAPEQAQGDPVDHRADIYALGIVLYEMLAGKVPFRAATPMATLYKQVNDPLPPLRRARLQIPGWLEAVTAKALAKRPEDRYQRAADMARDLRQATEPAARRATPAPSRRTPPPAGQPRKLNPIPILIGAIAALVLILTGTALYLLLGGGSDRPTGAGSGDTVTRVVLQGAVVTRVVTPPPGTEADQAGGIVTVVVTPSCPAWYQAPEAGKGVLLIENHGIQELQVEHVQGGSQRWTVGARKGDDPGRLLLQLAPGDHRFSVWAEGDGQGEIQAQIKAGQSLVCPVRLSGGLKQPVQLLPPPPGC
jgi:predicted Ser/Thr protein kinase